MLGCTLVRRNQDMLNAGIPGVTLYTGDNNDIKFPYRLLILPETHEDGVCEHACWASADAVEQQYQVHLAMRASACYTVGYSSKMQVVGKTETKRVAEALELSTQCGVATAPSENAAVARAGKRLARDLESQSTVRTTVECINLMDKAGQQDVLAAECITNVPSESFPGNELLQREEVESGNVRRTWSPGSLRQVVAATGAPMCKLRSTYAMASGDATRACTTSLPSR